MNLETLVLQQIVLLRNIWLNQFFTSITVLGSSTFVGVLLVGTALLKEKYLLKDLATAYTLNVAATWILKVFFTRPRPDISPIIDTLTTYSFPSGHTSTAFVIATVLASRKNGMQLYFYSLALLVGLSRLYLGAHYPSDIIVGGLLGYSVGKAVLNRDKIVEKIREL